MSFRLFLVLRIRVISFPMLRQTLSEAVLIIVQICSIHSTPASENVFLRCRFMGLSVASFLAGAPTGAYTGPSVMTVKNRGGMPPPKDRGQSAVGGKSVALTKALKIYLCQGAASVLQLRSGSCNSRSTGLNISYALRGRDGRGSRRRFMFVMFGCFGSSFRVWQESRVVKL